ncbi:MAG: hypothetical protein IPL84_14255 [Chitinophagaceae bacterium]|nr:hypothetical protein [Chitinophagaceae bacterium]
MRNFIFLLWLIFFSACNNAEETGIAKTDTIVQAAKTDTTLNYIHSFTDTALENRITNALSKLPFIIKSNQYIDSFSNHRHGIAYMLEDPQEHESDISVQAGYNGDDRFETYYRFFVNPKTLEIKVYDPVEDKKLSLKAFLKTQKQ